MLLIVAVFALTSALPVQTVRKLRQATEGASSDESTAENSASDESQLTSKFERLMDNLNKIEVCMHVNLFK